jgi:hypothetical protein
LTSEAEGARASDVQSRSDAPCLIHTLALTSPQSLATIVHTLSFHPLFPPSLSIFSSIFSSTPSFAGAPTDVQSRIDELRLAEIVAVGEITSKFVVEQRGDGGEPKLIDVTLRAHNDPQGRDGRYALRCPRLCASLLTTPCCHVALPSSPPRAATGPTALPS